MRSFAPALAVLLLFSSMLAWNHTSQRSGSTPFNTAAAAQPSAGIAQKYPNHADLSVVFDTDQGKLRPLKTKADWETRRQHILAGMQQAMGPLPSRENLPELDVQIKSERVVDGIRRLDITYAADANDRVPAILYVPQTDSPGARLPAILALHPTSPHGKLVVSDEGASDTRRYGFELAKRGYVVLCPDYPSFGDYKDYDFANDKFSTGTIKGIFNHMRGVDLLIARDDVDAQRIGVIGHSLGGHNAMFAAAFDDRIQAIVSSCGWTPFRNYYEGNLTGWTSDRYMPSIRDDYDLDPSKVPFDFPEIIASFAPRPFFSNSPLRDSNFDIVGVREGMAAARPIYALHNATDKLELHSPDTEHDFVDAIRHESYAFLDKALGHTPTETAKDYGDELPRIPPVEPQDALKTITTLPGWHLEQVVSEPLVYSPVAMSFDENGRLYVCEMIDYSEQATEHLGRIRLLEDTDGDGRFDKSTVFAEGLSWPTALIYSDGGVYVGAAPEIFYFKDTDGDGKADVREHVYTGFRRHNVQGLINSFHWGLDNRIHGATGTVGGQVKRMDIENGPVVDLNGRDFSFDPRTRELRPESGGAQHGMTFDDWGRKFACSNSDHIQMIMFEDRYSSRHPELAAPRSRVSIASDGPQAEVFRISPVEPWRIVRTRLRVSGEVVGAVEGGGRAAGYFTGATGTTIYRGNAWPAEYHGQAFVGDVGSNIIHRKELVPNNVGFIANRIDDNKEFVASTDIWFRPAQFANAPDGNLYILDVYREVIEHPASIPPQIKKHLDLTSGHDRGRIYRVVFDGFKQPALPQLGSASTAELVATLEHPNGWHRDTAARLLYQRNDASAVTPLKSLVRDSKSALGRMHALYALSGLNALSHDDITTGLKDESPRVREHAIRLSETFVNDPQNLGPLLLGLAEDADDRVRYQLAFTLGLFELPNKADALAKLAAQTRGNEWAIYAVLTSVGPQVASVLQNVAEDAQQQASPIGRAFMQELARQVGRRDNQAQFNQLLEWLQKPAQTEGKLALVRLAIIRGLAEGTAQNKAYKSWPKATQTLLAQLITSGIGQANELALQDDVEEADRVEAIAALGLQAARSNRELRQQALETAAELMSGSTSAEIQRAVIRMLGQHQGDEVSEIILDVWPRMSPQLRTASSEVLFSRAEWIAATLDAIESGDVAAADLDPARFRDLANHSDTSIKARATKLLESFTNTKRQDLVNQYRKSLELSGDKARGKAHFLTHCASCHRFEDQGFEIGPNLAAMVSRGPEAIMSNVIDPNSEVNPQYVNYIVLTDDGRTLTGMITAESATSITLQRAEGASDTILRSEIDQLRSSGLSIMPEGFEQQLDQQAMADLIAYLMSAGK